MTDLDTHDPLHDIVRNALLDEAKRAPRLRAEWSDADLVTVSPTETRRPGHLIAIGVAAALVLIASVVLLTRPTNNDNDRSTASTWFPDGTEFPLTDLGPATAVPNGPAVAALTRQVGVDGHPPQVIATTLGYRHKETATEWVCTSEYGSSGCRPVWMTWSWGITSSVDNGAADYDLWTVDGLPAGTAFVSYADGDYLLWQRPVAGFAAFPNVDGEDEVVIAYDESGAVIGRFGSDQEDQALTDPFPLYADLSDQDFAHLNTLTYDEMYQCLTEHGGTFDGGEVATFPNEVDQIAIWTQCVTTVQQVVADAVKTINPRFYDPATGRPEIVAPSTVDDN